MGGVRAPPPTYDRTVPIPGQAERWSRGCGSGGVGFSGSCVAYNPECLVGNWVEDRAGACSPHSRVLAEDLPFLPHTIHRTSFPEEGRFGAEMLQFRAGPAALPNRSHDVLTRHGSFDEPPIQCLATVYSLVHGHKQLGEPATQSYLWQGRKRNDMLTPCSVPALSTTTAKRSEWEQQNLASPYATSQRASQLPSVLAAAADPPKASLQPWTSRGATASHPGRRPKGDFVAEADKGYRKTGLRGNWGW